MHDMNIRPGVTTGLQLAYAVGGFAEDDSFTIKELGGETPLGGILCSPSSDYAVRVSPDGSGRSMFGGLNITPLNGNGKAWYIKDSLTGEVWSPFFRPKCEASDDYEVRYLPGQMSVYSLKQKIASTLTIASLPGHSCEIWRVKLENRSALHRTISFTTYIEPNIGHELETGYLDQQKTLLMGRPLSTIAASGSSFKNRDIVIFHSSTLVPIRFQTEKSDFIGEGRTLRNPQYFDSDEHTGKDGSSVEAIASLTVEIELPIEGEAEFAFCFGVAANTEMAIQTAQAFSKIDAVNEAIEVARDSWRDLSNINVTSQDRGFDALVNTWLPYEAYAGWIGHRTGKVCLDPSIAADSLKRLYAFSGMLIEEYRANLLSFASGISLQGTYSPDNESVIALPPAELLWLATCTARYIAETGDESILGATVADKNNINLTLEEHCERIIKMCIQDGKAHNSLLTKTIRLWSLMSKKDAHERKIQLSTIFSPPDDDERHPEERSLPRRLRYFQSVSPVLSERPLMQEIESLFDNDGPSISYTGVDSCLYSTLVEQILGLEATNLGLTINPNLPKSWQECKVTRLFRKDIYNIHLKRAIMPSKQEGSNIVVDGEPVMGNMLPYFGDAMEHKVEVLVI